ncbi:anti-anti-sigma factor [Crossiella equi]|uniref:Anti-anti-sigma factor n=1 Tax=Crossiella equi TaxID=130796 RepID=A0ABS5ARY4_9PSEU|nr:STAS domain-containing protein [Crossiella equi]MBP2479329.1 anti-anti-sigma factor [Crossiella equi]
MTTPLTLTPGQDTTGSAVLVVRGEIDMSNADQLATALDALAGAALVDLTAVGYLDSAGLNVLFARADRLELVVPPLLAPVVEISGLAQVATVRTSS